MLTEEQKARIERNRQEALAKRARMLEREEKLEHKPSPSLQSSTYSSPPEAKQARFELPPADEPTAPVSVAVTAAKEDPEPPQEPVPPVSGASAISREISQLLRCSKSSPREVEKCYLKLEEAMQEADGDEQFKAAVLNRLEVLMDCCVGHIQSEDERCVVAAIKLSAHVSHNVELCRDLPAASIKSLIAAIAQLADQSDSTSIKFMVLWYISMQLFSTAQAAKVAPIMLLAVCNATRNEEKLQLEGIRALNRLLDQFPPKIFLQHPAAPDDGTDSDGGWWRVVFSNFVHAKERVRLGALGLAERVVPLIAELEAEHRTRLNEAAVKELMAKDGILLKLSAMLHKKKRGEDVKDSDSGAVARSAITAWGWMVRFAESKIIKDGHANAFVKVMEPAFVHHFATVRQEAFKSWLHMAFVFDEMSSTLAHPKRLALICRPFREIWPQDSSFDVRKTAMIVWSHLLLLLTRRCTVEKSSTFEVVVSSILNTVALAEKEHDLRLLLIDIVGGLLCTNGSNGAHGPTLDADGPATKVLQLIGDAPATNLTLRLEFVKSKTSVLFDLLMQFGLSDTDEELMKVTRVWTGFVERLSAEESRDSAEVLSRASVLYWVECIMATISSSEDGEPGVDDAVRARKEAVMRVICGVTRQPSAARLLFCASTPLQYGMSETSQLQVKLAPYLVGAVSIAAQGEPGRAAQLIRQILALFPGDPRSYKQLFEVVDYVANAKGIVRDSGMPMRLWMEACTGYKASLDVSRHVLSSPGQAKLQAPVLTLVLAQIIRLLPNTAQDAEQVETKCRRELEDHWVALFDQLREVTKSKSAGHGLTGAVRLSLAISKNCQGLVKSPLAPTVRHLDFVLGVLLDENYLENSSKSKFQAGAQAASQLSADHPLQPIMDLWALAFRCAYHAFEENTIDMALLKSIISRVIPILDKVAAVGGPHQGPMTVLMSPVLKCLGACSRQGSGNKRVSDLGRAGAAGIVDEVERVWAKMVESVLHKATHKDIGTLSPLLVSALSINNAKIQTTAVECWNSSLSIGAEKAELPVPLLYILKKLSKRVQINLEAEDTTGSGSPTNNEEGQMADSQSQEPIVLTKSPARLMHSQVQGKGSLLTTSTKRTGSQPGSLHNTPCRSPGKTLISSSEKTEVKSEALVSEDARDVDYVQIANAKRKLLLTEHQREARKEARTGGGGLTYTSLEDPESRMVGSSVDGEMLVMDSRTQWSTDNSSWPIASTATSADAPAV